MKAIVKSKKFPKISILSFNGDYENFYITLDVNGYRTIVEHRPYDNVIWSENSVLTSDNMYKNAISKFANNFLADKHYDAFDKPITRTMYFSEQEQVHIEEIDIELFDKDEPLIAIMVNGASATIFWEDSIKSLILTCEPENAETLAPYNDTILKVIEKWIYDIEAQRNSASET